MNFRALGVKNNAKMSVRSSSRVPEQLDDQGMRDGKGVRTIRYSCYHKETGCREDVGRGGGDKHVKGKINHQLQKFTPPGLIS